MKLVFFGSPAIALVSLKRIIEEGHRIELVISQPDKPTGRGKKLIPTLLKRFAQDLNIPVYQPVKIRKDQIALEKIKKINPDLNVVVAYGQIISSSIIFLPKYNSINVHFSLLPKYRGASPIQWALLNGERKTGVTIFELNERMDEGDILAKEEVDIHPEEGASELEARLAHKGADLLVKTIAKIGKIKPQKQDHSQATYAPKIKKEDGRIKWEKNAIFIERLVKAYTPWPSAYTFLADQRIKILKGKKEAFKGQSSSPGEILDVKKKGIEVCCGDASVFLIENLQPENKKPMSAYSFSLGAKIRSGDRFI